VFQDEWNQPIGRTGGWRLQLEGVRLAKGAESELHPGGILPKGKFQI
jgi:hypothetical protein